MSELIKATPKASIIATMAARYEIDADEFNHVIQATIMPKDATQAEFLALLMVANVYDLNPVMKEIYAFPKKGGGIVPVVSVDGWIKIVNARPDLEGFEFDDHHDGEGRLTAVTCRIWRVGRKMPIVITEYLSECYRPTDPWKMPHRMLRHKAFIQCARYAFGISGIADEDEGRDIADAAAMTPRRQRTETPKPPGSTAAGNVIDAEVRDVTAQQEQPKPVETVKPKDEARSAPAEERKPDETEKVDTAAQERRYEEAQERQQEQQAETERNDDDTFPSDRPSQQDRVPDYKGSELLAEFSEELDNFGSVEEIDTWLGKAKNGKPNRGMVIVAALTPGDQEEARELYRQAKARIEEEAKGEQPDGGGAEQDGDAEAHVNESAADAGDQKQDPGEAEDDENQRDPSTMTWAEYDAYARAYIDAATDKELLKKIWFSESAIRTALEKNGAPKKETDALKAYRTDKINKLAGIA